MYRNYLVLGVSLIASGILFYFLITTQDKINKEKQLVEIFYAKSDIDIYSKVDRNNLNRVYIEDSLAQDLQLLTKIDNSTLYNTNIKAGEVIYSNMTMNENDKIPIREKELIGINIKNDQNSIANCLNKNSHINIYVKVPKKYLPTNCENLKKIEYVDSEYVTFLYFENIRPIQIIDKEGKKIESSGMAESVIIEALKEQSIYINSVRDVAEFYISIV